MEQLTDKQLSLSDSLSHEPGIVEVAMYILDRPVSMYFIDPDNNTTVAYYADRYGVDPSVVEEALGLALDRLDPDIHDYDFDFPQSPDTNCIGDY